MKTVDYLQQANDFLNSTHTRMSAKFLKFDKYFENDKESRGIYQITLQRGKTRRTFRFGQSIADSGAGKVPSAYDVLACLQKYDIGSFDDFCSEFGYEPTKSSERIYKAVCREFEMVCDLWNSEEIERLSEIN